MLCDNPEVWDGVGDGKEGQEGEGGTNGESSMETYTLPYVK